MSAIKITDESWRLVKSTTMNRAWIKVWPECVDSCEDVNEVPVIQTEIIELARQIGFSEVDDVQIEELLLSHNEEMSTDELLQVLEYQTASDEGDIPLESSESQDVTTVFPKARLNEVLKHLETAMETCDKYDPDKGRSEDINNNICRAIVPYKELYRKMEHSAHQRRIDSFFKAVEQPIQSTTSTSTTIGVSDESSE